MAASLPRRGCHPGRVPLGDPPVRVGRLGDPRGRSARRGWGIRRRRTARLSVRDSPQPRRPRGGKGGSGTGAYRPNTNLEQISDWLTKILVGVGLVQFTTLARHAGDLVEFLGPPLGGAPLGESFAGATLVIFSISGFLAFYLVTRIYLPRAFAHADRSATERKVRKNLATTNLLSASRDASTRLGGVRVDRKEIAAVVDRASELTELGTPHILWVDDKPQNNTREINAMQALGMQVMTCLSTDEALTRLGRSSFDVVITDMGRPGNPEAGYELLASMRKAKNSTPVLIYSSSNKPEHRKRAQEQGAFGSTNRPDELLDLVIKASQAPN